MTREISLLKVYYRQYKLTQTTVWSYVAIDQHIYIHI